SGAGEAARQAELQEEDALARHPRRDRRAGAGGRAPRRAALSIRPPAIRSAGEEGHQPRAAMTLPAFYDPRNAAEWSYAPDVAKVYEEARAWRLKPAAEDAAQVHLLLIDVQRDFCFPQGTLYVGGRSGRGALDDNRRTAEFIYRNLHRITRTTCTLDSHLPFQIFFPSFWVD